MSNSFLFKSFLGSFLGSVFLQLISMAKWNWRVESWWMYLILLIGLIIFFFGFKQKLAQLLFFCSLGVWLGVVVTNNQLDDFYDRPEKSFESIGYVFQEPIPKEDYQKIVVCPAERVGNEIKPSCKERILLFEDLQKVYYFGDILVINCELKNPENKYPKFNYINFLAKDKIYQICQGVQIKKIDNQEVKLVGFHASRDFFYRVVFGLKGLMENKINTTFSYPESAYLAGLLLGGEDRLPAEIQENFRRTGTIHTIAVSGFNITILASFFVVFGILIGFFRQRAFWLAVFGIVFFVLMIGSPASAVRAAIMGVLLLWAAKKGRLADSVPIVILAAALMIVFSPLIILYDVGFQLSFLASLSIILVYGPLSERFNVKNDFLELKSILLVTISAQLGVLGIIMYNFETFSPISLLANLIILPLIPLMMLTGFLTVAVAFVSPVLASLVALPTQIALGLEIAIIEHLSAISWASVEIGDIGVTGLISYYLLFAVLAIYLAKKR